MSDMAEYVNDDSPGETWEDFQEMQKQIAALQSRLDTALTALREIAGRSCQSLRCGITAERYHCVTCIAREALKKIGGGE